MKKMVPVLIAIVLIIIIAGAAFGMKVVERFSYSKERMDLNEYYQLASAEEVALVLNNDIKEEKGILRDGICYLDLPSAGGVAPSSRSANPSAFTI